MFPIIKQYADNAPELSGVYQMFDIHNKVIYVGKAKNLKKRLLQYISPVENRICIFIVKVVKVTFIVTSTEREALMTEMLLIKDIMPKFNIMLKDDKSIPFIEIDKFHEYPRIVKYSGKRKKFCFGPFANREVVKKIIYQIRKSFKLRSCSNVYFKNRKSPCLDYQINLCSAPCVGKVSKIEYDNNIKKSISLLSGKLKSLQSDMLSKMMISSEKMDYEKAIFYRDIIKSLHNLSSNLGNLELKGFFGDYIIFSSNEKYNIGCFRVCYCRDNGYFGNYNYFVENFLDVEEDELLLNFIFQMYENNDNVNIITDINIDEKKLNAFYELTMYRIRIIYKSINDDMNIHLIKQEIDNFLYEKIGKFDENLTKLVDIFKLSNIPKRIEVYDNSHLSGENAVGVMIVFSCYGFEKKEYRQFKIKNTSVLGNDCGMLKEVLTRRFSKDLEMPDLILIDGGVAQLNVAKKVVKSFGIDVACVGIAKGVNRNAGDETFYLQDGSFVKIGIGINNSDRKLLFFLQNLRDESHRFAISCHRRARQKGVSISVLDNIVGVGLSRKKALLSYFGSIDNLRLATVEEISKVPRINKKMAEIIVSYFNTSI